MVLDLRWKCAARSRMAAAGNCAAAGLRASVSARDVEHGFTGKCLRVDPTPAVADDPHAVQIMSGGSAVLSVMLFVLIRRSSARSCRLAGRTTQTGGGARQAPARWTSMSGRMTWSGHMREALFIVAAAHRQGETS